MAFSVGRLICRRLLLSTGSCSRMMMSTAIILPDNNNNNNNANSFSSSPWLMLPPKLNDDNNSITYDFYSLAENQLLPPRPHIGLTMMPKPIHDLSFCGSTHGWLALSNPDTLELVLYDPISHCHINLPPIPNIHEDNYDQNWRVTKLILSSSDPQHNSSCRAVMIYSCGHLAFCCPSCPSKEWTLLDRSYDDIVYSSKQDLFFALKPAVDELETWDLSNPSSSPKMIDTIDYYKYNLRDYMEMSPRERMLSPTKYLVVADDDHVILLLTRYVMDEVAPDGSYIEYYTYPSSLTPLCPHMTIDFDIQVYDQEGRTLKPLEESRRRSLGDLTLFIGGQAESVALSATRFPELKPNSIYFTDPYPTRYDPQLNELLVGGEDIGIFDFEKKTVSPCYYPRDLRSLKMLVPSPMWFFPRGG